MRACGRGNKCSTTTQLVSVMMRWDIFRGKSCPDLSDSRCLKTKKDWQRSRCNVAEREGMHGSFRERTLMESKIPQASKILGWNVSCIERTSQTACLKTAMKILESLPRPRHRSVNCCWKNPYRKRKGICPGDFGKLVRKSKTNSDSNIKLPVINL